MVRVGVVFDEGRSNGDRVLGDLVVGLRLNGLGGVDSPVDTKSLCVTFKVPI